MSRETFIWITTMLSVSTFLAFIVRKILADARNRETTARPVPEAFVNIPLDMLHNILDERDEAIFHAKRLRSAAESLVNQWPIAFSPEELEKVQRLMDEAVEVGL